MRLRDMNLAQAVKEVNVGQDEIFVRASNALRGSKDLSSSQRTDGKATIARSISMLTDDKVSKSRKKEDLTGKRTFIETENQFGELTQAYQRLERRNTKFMTMTGQGLIN